MSLSYSYSYSYSFSIFQTTQCRQRLWLQTLAMIMKVTLTQSQSTQHQQLLQGQLFLVLNMILIIIMSLSHLRVKGCLPLWNLESKGFFVLLIWLKERSLVSLIFVSSRIVWIFGQLGWSIYWFYCVNYKFFVGYYWLWMWMKV